jgi:hypothetical protein
MARDNNEIVCKQNDKVRTLKCVCENVCLTVMEHGSAGLRHAEIQWPAVTPVRLRTNVISYIVCHDAFQHPPTEWNVNGEIWDWGHLYFVIKLKGMYGIFWFHRRVNWCMQAKRLFIHMWRAWCKKGSYVYFFFSKIGLRVFSRSDKFAALCGAWMNCVRPVQAQDFIPEIPVQ